MKRIEILNFKSPNRAPLKVDGFLFGEELKGPSLAIVGAMSGDHINQLFVASKMVEYLRQKEEEGKITGKILIIPAVNTYALNMGQTFWPLDKTDINMMFPGYTEGETTQRIAAKLFESLQGYDYGIILEGRRDQGMCLPYVKLMQSGYEDLESARDLGMRFIHYRTLSPIETVMLQYNWQLWETKAFSVVFGKNSTIDKTTSNEVQGSLIRFMSKRGLLKVPAFGGYESNVISQENITVLKASYAGIFDPQVACGTAVEKGEMLGKITDALSGKKLEKIIAPVSGVVTCQYSHPLIFQNSIAFRIATAE